MHIIAGSISIAPWSRLLRDSFDDDDAMLRDTSPLMLAKVVISILIESCDPRGRVIAGEGGKRWWTWFGPQELNVNHDTAGIAQRV